MPIAIARLFVLFVFAAASPLAAGQTASGPVPVLMLGDNNHHRPRDLSKVLAAPMRAAGFEISYTDDVAALRADNINKFGAILLFLNTEVIPKEEEDSLMKFVEGGKGAVVLHCACSCFKNSDRYTKLVGGRFKSHNTEVFRAEIVDATHPVMRGFAGFESWDETYRHSDVASDIRILMARKEGLRLEPWTWVRDQGKGRVFYTASGHDERTWNVPAYQDLVARGLRWATKQLNDDAPAIEREPFKMSAEYREAEATLQIPKPLSPADSMKHMHLQEGFRVELFAAEPDIVKPVAVAWDERGRAWVCESVDYPHDVLEPGTQGHDRITICEDTDGDGRADKFTRFAEGLNMPQGILPVKGGCVVAMAPDIIYMIDRDGDGKCDERKVLYSGFHRGDTHAMHGNFRLGLDGWIWGSCGYSGLEVQSGGRAHRSGQCIFRFRTDRDAFEVVTNTSNNTWGLGFAEDGEVFASTANGSHSVFVAAPNRILETVRGWHAAGNATIEDHTDAHPVTDDVFQVDFNGGYTATCDHEFYDSSRWPAEWRGRSFIGEPTMHVVHVDIPEIAGSGYVSHDGFNLMASSDPWTAPIQASVGPDGNVWFVDWYNAVVQHNPYGPYKGGPGNAHRNPLRDKTHGRIYKIVYAGKDARAAAAPPRLDGAGGPALVAALMHPDRFWRVQAHRLLIENHPAGVEPMLESLAAEALAGRGPLEAGQHALWLLKSFGAIDAGGRALALARESAAGPAPMLKKAAIQILPRDAASLSLLLEKKLLDDPDLGVRRHALLAIAEMPADERAGAAVLDCMRRTENARDRWLPTCAIPAAARHAAGFLRSALAGAAAADGAAPPRADVMANGSIDKFINNEPQGWHPVTYSGDGKFSVAEGRAGSALHIEAAAGTDASWSYPVPVEPNTTYRLSAWIRTRDVEKDSGRGALVNVHELQSPIIATPAVLGTRDWTQVETTFDSGDHRQLTINALLGGWGRSRGAAWFDDISLRAIGSASGEASVVRAVLGHVVRGGDADAIAGILHAMRGRGEAVLAPMLAGLAQAKPANFNDTIRAALLDLAGALPAECVAGWTALARSWGVEGEAVRAAAAQLGASLRSRAADEKLSPDERASAAEQWLAADPSQASAEALIQMIDARVAPELAARWLRALGAVADPAVPKMLFERWRALSPPLRRESIELLLHREAWSRSLVEAIESGVVAAAELDIDQTSRTLSRRDAEWRARAEKALAASGRRASSDERAKLVADRLPILRGAGDKENGMRVFRAQCVACHSIAGEGGKVGPDLAGVHEGKRDEILTHILDPNRVVEANYRRWMLWTKSGGFITGRLLAETKSAVELLDSTGASHVVPRGDIDEFLSDKLSLMPEGFEKLPDQELLDLVEMIASTRKKATAK